MDADRVAGLEFRDATLGHDGGHFGLLQFLDYGHHLILIKRAPAQLAQLFRPERSLI
jgi:hypothetical protein